MALEDIFKISSITLDSLWERDCVAENLERNRPSRVARDARQDWVLFRKWTATCGNAILEDNGGQTCGISGRVFNVFIPKNIHFTVPFVANEVELIRDWNQLPLTWHLQINFPWDKKSYLSRYKALERLV